MADLLVFGLHHFAATVHAVGGNVVRAVYFTGSAIYRQSGSSQRVVGAVHAAARGGFFVPIGGWPDEFRRRYTKFFPTFSILCWVGAARVVVVEASA